MCEATSIHGMIDSEESESNTTHKSLLIPFAAPRLGRFGQLLQNLKTYLMKNTLVKAVKLFFWVMAESLLRSLLFMNKRIAHVLESALTHFISGQQDTGIEPAVEVSGADVINIDDSKTN